MRVLLPDATPTTVLGRIQSSVLPLAAVQPAMRRVLRDHGPVSKRFGIATPHLRNLISDVASARVSVSPAWTQPEQRLTLASSQAASPATGTPPGTVGWLGNDWDVSRPLLLACIASIAALAAILRQLNESLRILHEILKLGDLQSTLSAASLTPEAVEEVRSAAGWARHQARTTAFSVARNFCQWKKIATSLSSPGISARPHWT